MTNALNVRPGFRGDGHPIVKMKCRHCGVLHATHLDCPIDLDAPGRTMHEAAEAGDSYEVHASDGKAALWMPGCIGVYQTISAARVHWKHRLGQMVKIWRVLPGSGVGCMYLEPMGEVAL